MASGDRLFRWHCPQCDSTIVLMTGEERDDEVRGVDAAGWMEFQPRCPICQALMIDEDTVAYWYICKRFPVTPDKPVSVGSGFTLKEADFAEWRAEQVKVAHDENCDVYGREEQACGCGADAQRARKVQT